MMGTLVSAGSLKFDCLTKIGAQLQSWLFSKGTAFCGRNKIRMSLTNLVCKIILLKLKSIYSLRGNIQSQTIEIETSVHMQGFGMQGFGRANPNI